MQLLFILSFVLNLINISIALVCPIYAIHRRTSSHNSLIKDCQHANCSFTRISRETHACLGVYSNSSGDIQIKQLSTIPSDEQCLTSPQCLLDVDPLNSQAFSCCCSSDNCTLNWIGVSTTTYRSIFVTNTTRIQLMDLPEKYFSWKILFILLLLITIIILLVLAFSLWKSFRNPQENDGNKSLIKPSFPTSIEQLFCSAQQIAIGKHSIVYRASWNNETIALKIYKQASSSTWQNEVTLLKSIQHESIIKILLDGQYNSHLYLVLPYYENGTLQSFLRSSNRTLSIDQCLRFLRSLASALSYLHFGRSPARLPIVHRDIKSSNILMCSNNFNLCLTDFGAALSLPQVLTEKDFIQIGTIRYMAPELLEGVIAHTREALCSVDMYALALVMWEIITQCDVYPSPVYRPPYEEYMTNISDGSSFAEQIYDIVVVRRLRPTFNRSSNNKEHTSNIDELCSLIDTCWTTDSDMRINAQTLSYKLNQMMG